MKKGEGVIIMSPISPISSSVFNTQMLLLIANGIQVNSALETQKNSSGTSQNNNNSTKNDNSALSKKSDTYTPSSQLQQKLNSSENYTSNNTSLNKTKNSSTYTVSSTNTTTLNSEQNQQITNLKKADTNVRAHEAAHESAGGSLVRGKSFTYTTGPDGKLYATGGEVQIDLSTVPGNPQATIDKMEQAIRAAMAPPDPSSQDRLVAATAASIEQEARAELEKENNDIILSKKQANENLQNTSNSNNSLENSKPSQLVNNSIQNGMINKYLSNQQNSYFGTSDNYNTKLQNYNPYDITIGNSKMTGLDVRV